MRKKLVFTLFFLLASVLISSTILNSSAQLSGVDLLWNSGMSVNDLAVSKDGNYVVAVNGTGIYYYASEDSNQDGGTSPNWQTASLLSQSPLTADMS